MNVDKLILPFKREIWEHQGAFYGVFTALGALIILIALIGIVQVPDVDQISIIISGSEFEYDSDYHHESELLQMLDMGLKSIVAAVLHLFVLVSSMVTFFYLLGALFDDRKDRSILFWKSMPVSETQNVLTKFVTGLLVIPAIAAAIGFVTTAILGVLLCVWLSLFTVFGFFEVLTKLDFFRALSMTLVFIVVSGIWIAPFYAWLMLASSFARKSPFLWAAAPPILLLVAETLLTGKSTFFYLISLYVPDVEGYDNYLSWATMMSLIKLFFMGPEALAGISVTSVCLLACIWLRNNRYEI